jgi:hypothetical protein
LDGTKSAVKSSVPIQHGTTSLTVLAFVVYINHRSNYDHPHTLAIWLAESSIEFVLALNRCLNFAAPKLAETLFGSSIPQKRKSKWRVRFWIVPSILFAIYYFLYGEVNHYSPIMHSHAFSPHHGYAEDLVDQVVCNSLHSW